MDISPFSLSNSAKNCRHRHAENCRIFLIGTRGRPTHINNQKGTTASNAERPAFCAHKSAPSSRPSADPLAWISLNLHGWTPCMHLSVCLSSLRFSSGRMNPVLGGALQSAATLCAGCDANGLATFPSCGAAAPSVWTTDPPRGEPRFAVAPRLRLPTSNTRLGSFSRAFAC